MIPSLHTKHNSVSNGSTVVSIIRQRRRYLLPTCCQQLSYRLVQKPNRAADWVCTASSYSEGPGFHSQSKGLLILGCYSVHKSFVKTRHVKTRQRGFLPDTCQCHLGSDAHCLITEVLACYGTRKFIVTHHKPNESTPHCHILFIYKHYLPIYTSFYQVVSHPHTSVHQTVSDRLRI